MPPFHTLGTPLAGRVQRGPINTDCNSAEKPDEQWPAEDAESEDTELIADDVTALLGLAAVVESRGKNGKASDREIDDFVQKFGYDNTDSN